MLESSTRRLISVVVPVLDEADNVEPLYERVRSVMDGLADRYDFEVVFTDNHSADGTFDRVRELAGRDPRVRAARFSRDFGFQRSIWTGYTLARGDAAIQLDADMQDPPELIPEFVRLWEEGYKVVYGVRRKRTEGAGMNAARHGFYKVVAALSEDDRLPVDAGDFRLVDRAVLDELCRMPDTQPYLRGAIAALGFEQIGVPYDRSPRSSGRSKFGLRELLGLSTDAILNHSTVPLRIATYVGLTVAIVTIFAMIAFVAARLALGQGWPAGFATETVLILLSISLNALFLGIIGEYLGRIYKQVKPRPITVIEESVGVRPGERAGAVAADADGDLPESG